MWRYRLLLMLLALPAITVTAWQAWQTRDIRFLRERLGFSHMQQRDGTWLHAASVGEVNAVMPLIRELRRRYPQKPVTLTTATPTGGAVAQQLLPASARHHYLPIDFSWASRRFIKNLQPNCALIMETELWPNLYRHCRQNDIPLLIINGRISEKTLNAPTWLRRLCPGVLANVSAILARSETDRERYISLGAAPDKTRTVGNIKFVCESAGRIEPISLGRPSLLAASTHDDEELRIARLWRSLEGRGERLLVIVPRHPKRSAAIQRQLATVTKNVAVRSRGDSITAETEIYLADTLGELTGFIAAAELVFMGGSLVPVGGHNILEVAQLGKGVLFGPHMETFADEASLFIAADAGIEVSDDDALRNQIARLLADSDRARRLGENGRRLVGQCHDILPRYLSEIENCCAAYGRPLL